MSKKTWILISCLVLSLTLGLGGSLAYLTDTDTKINTFTMGDVKIEVDEETGTHYPGMMPGVEITKKAKIINRGSNAAWVFLTAAVPEELSNYITFVWNEDVIVEDKGVVVWENGNGGTTLTKPDTEGVDGRFYARDDAGRGYRYETFVWKSKVAPADLTENLLVGVKLNEWVNLVDGQYYDMRNGNLDSPINGLEALKVIVTGHAIQADGIASWDQAYDAYMGQWPETVLDVGSTNEGAVITSGIATIKDYIVLDAASEETDVVTASGEGTVVKIDGGYYKVDKFENWENSCVVWAKDGATVEIHGGEFVHHGYEKPATSGDHIDMIYAGTNGKIEIYSGTFYAETDGVWLLNEKDNSGEIVVYGGDFLNWNPADNDSEGAHTNFVEDGLVVWVGYEPNGDIWYRVRNDNEDEERNANKNGWQKWSVTNP